MKSLSSLLKLFICGFIVFIIALSSQASPGDKVMGVKKIYYMIASSKGFGQSSFGHSYLRLGLYNTPHPDDLVLELVADVSAANLRLLRGLGVGKAYARAAILESYQNVQYEMNFQQNRDLASTEVLLTNAQRSLILQRIATVVDQGHMGDYSFFNQNCAQGIAVLFGNLNLDADLLDSPRNVLARLQQKGFAGKTYTDLGIGNKGAELIGKYKELVSKIEKVSPDFKKEFLVGSFDEQFLGFLLIQQSIPRMSPADQNLMLRFLKSLAYLQPRVTRNDLLESVNGKRNLQVVKLGSRSIEAKPNEWFSVRNWKFVSQNDDIIVKITLDSSGATRKDKYNRQELDVDAPDLRKESSEILFNGQNLGVLHSDDTAADSHGAIFKNSVVVPVLRERARNASEQVIDVFMIVDSEELPVKSEVGSDEIIPLINNDPALPSCYGFVDLQKALLERAAFIPHSTQLTCAEYINLLRTLLFEKKLVYFPGVKDISELIQTVTPATFKKLIFEYHQSSYRSVWAVVNTYFKSSTLSKMQDLESLRVFGNYGLYFSIYFRVYQGDKKTPVGHALLVKGLIRKGSRYYLNAYDPNLGAFSSDLFYIDSLTGKFHSTLYGVTEIQIIPPDFESALASLKLLKARNGEFLKSYVEQTKTYSLSIPQILMMM